MEFIQSERGKRKSIYEGYIYVKQKDLANGVVSYECERRRHNNCKAKIKVKGHDVLGRVNSHTHAPDINRPEKLKVQQEIKTKAVTTEATPQQIITQAVEGMTDGASTQLPAIQHIRRNIRRQKQSVSAPHPLPSNPADIIIPEEYKVTSHGEKFLLYDSGMNNQRMLIFSTTRNMRLLENSTAWFGDGTFKTVPDLFYQLYSIHVLTSHRVIPCVYALMPNKQQSTYEELFRELLVINPTLHPIDFLIDYEQAARRAIEETFPDATVKGCFYHLSQNVYRKVQIEGLQQLYQTDHDFSLKIRMIPALAFVPQHDVINAFEILQEHLPSEADPIIDYFEDVYVGRVRRNRRGSPSFPISMWNMYDRVLEDLPRTNNSLEGWHNRLQSNISACHPNIWKFLQVLKKEQALNEVIINQMLAGQQGPPKRKKYQDLSTRITNLVRDYENRDVLDFLRGVAHNLQF